MKLIKLFISDYNDDCLFVCLDIMSQINKRIVLVTIKYMPGY